MVPPDRLFRRILPTNVLIARYYPLTDVVGIEIGRGVAGSVKPDDPVQFLPRKTFTTGRASQTQGDVVALPGTEGIFLLEAVDESLQEAFARHIGSGLPAVRSVLARRGNGSGDGNGSGRSLRSDGTGRTSRRHLLLRTVREGRGVGLEVGGGVPRVVAGLGDGGTLLVVGMAHTAAHGPAHGGIERCIAAVQVLRADADEDLHSFARNAAEDGSHVGQSGSQRHDGVRAVCRVVQVDAQQAAVLPQVAHGMPAEAAGRRRHTGHGRLDALRLGFLSALRAQAAVPLHLRAETVAADVGHELRERGRRSTLAPHAAEAREADGCFSSCFHTFL